MIIDPGHDLGFGPAEPGTASRPRLAGRRRRRGAGRVGTLVSFVLCLIYLSLLPFHVWGLGVLIATSALAVDLLGRPDDAITAAITTTVIMVEAAVSPAHAWEEPILRFADTVVGVVVGVAAAWLGLRVIHPLLQRKP
jgi:uncharacterized membrane protein YccC